MFLDGETDIDTLVLLFGETGQVNRVSKLFSFSYENLRKHFTKNMMLLDGETGPVFVVILFETSRC